MIVTVLKSFFNTKQAHRSDKYVRYTNVGQFNHDLKQQLESIDIFDVSYEKIEELFSGQLMKHTPIIEKFVTANHLSEIIFFPKL